VTATTAFKTGVTDTAAGAGVHEYEALQGPLAALSQVVTAVPHGDPWQIKGSMSHTPTIVTDTFPPHPIMAYKVPTGKALLFTGGNYHNLIAATDYIRVCRRHLLFGYQATAAPAAPAAPTVALLALTDGIGTSGAYTYKIAPLDTFQREGPASVASSSVTLTSTNRGVTVTPPAAGTGVTGYNIYRTLAGGSTWYFVGATFGATAYLDAQPDASIDTALVPLNNWATGAVTGETMDGPGEIIIEVGAIALTGAPTHLVYTGAYGQQKQAFAVTFPTAIGARLRAKTFGETLNFVATPTVAANLWHGPFTTDVRLRHEEDFAATGVSGVNAVPSAGSFTVWGQQTIGTTERDEATAAIKARRILPTNPHGVLIPPLGEIVCEIGAIAAGVASVRDVTLSGMLLPTTGT
jgi:hypothetical protein